MLELFFTYVIIWSIFTLSVDISSHLAVFSQIEAFSHLKVPQTRLFVIFITYARFESATCIPMIIIGIVTSRHLTETFEKIL